MKSTLVLRGRRLPAASLLGTAAVGLTLLVFYAGTPASAAEPEEGTAPAPAPAYTTPAPMAPGPLADREDLAALEDPAGVEDLEALEERVARVTAAWGEAQRFYDVAVAPIERVLLRYRKDPALAERIAIALVREANRAGLEPRLLLAVLLVENPWLDPQIRSPVGAIGLMQVMPVHRGAWRECGADLEDIDANVCHGAQIFAHYFERSGGNVERALLRYNGCVNGTNTPNCHQYPYHVFARAGRASVLAWTGTGIEGMSR